MSISMGSVKPLILAHLANSPMGKATSTDTKLAVLALVGGDPKLTHDINCIGNGRHDLKAAGCVEDGAVRGEWIITDVGRAAHASGVIPTPPPRPAKNPRPAKETPAATETPTNPEGELARVTDGATAEELPTETEEIPTATETPTETEIPTATETPAPTPAPKRRLKVAEPAAAAVVVPEWLSDPEIRATVIENQDCFGAFAARSPACGECALSGYCRNAKAAQLDLLARKLVVQNPMVNTPIPATVANLDAAVGEVLNPTATKKAAQPTAGTMAAAFDGVCANTGEPIKKGEMIRYIGGVGMVKVKV